MALEAGISFRRLAPGPGGCGGAALGLVGPLILLKTTGIWWIWGSMSLYVDLVYLSSISALCLLYLSSIPPLSLLCLLGRAAVGEPPWGPLGPLIYWKPLGFGGIWRNLVVRQNHLFLYY